MVIGGGFAGVWSAAAAARLRERTGRTDMTVMLITPGDQLVIRPRLYEPEPTRMQVPLDRILGPIGVQQLRAQVTQIDTRTDEVTTRDGAGRTHAVHYKRLVLATGSHLRHPDLPGAEHLHNVDTMESAIALENHLDALPAGPDMYKAVVVGAGFTGLEVATELVDRLRSRASWTGRETEVRVVLVERADQVGPDIGDYPRAAIEAALKETGVEVQLGVGVTAVSSTGVQLTNGGFVAAPTVIWAGGLTASGLTRQIAGRRDDLDRILVDDALRVPDAPHVFAAGDTASAALDDGRTVLQSCQYASQLGKHAGHNAMADLVGVAPVAFSAIPYVTCLDLGAAGAIFTTGFERSVQLTGTAGKDRKRLINQEWIYPPLDDAKRILAAADHASNRR
ncbi:NAD(P)/FAD-dependent oxidoreductase [Kribbella sp. NPDC051586]|uniref:NAD(P)/FAD-dependent oxidoreductase n=1 Tax=Kribbella sp. NPDC051586 TaxID=3364118 RepID=UPI003793E87F